MKEYIVCFDVETTGLSPIEDYIIQLAMVKINNKTFEEVDKRMWYIEPAHAYEITHRAFEVTGFCEDEIIQGTKIRSI